MNKADWINKTTKDKGAQDIARHTGMSKSTAFRRLKDLSFTAEDIINIARAYHADPIEGLVAFQYLTPEEPTGKPYQEPTMQDTLKDCTDEQLLAEVRRRMQR